MIRSALYREPKPFVPTEYRHKKLAPLSDYSIAKEMHAVFLAATEFPSAALSFPIIFVHTGEALPGGKAMISPVALLGISVNENLHVDGTRWDAAYVPAFIRRFPFLTAGVPGSDQSAVYIDAAWPGIDDAAGEPLYGPDGEPTQMLRNALEFLRQFDIEQQRTRQFCLRLLELDVLKEMTLTATLPGNDNLTINGFLTVDEEKLNALSDADVLQLHRAGMLMLLHVHLASLGNLRPLLERKARRMGTTLA